MLVLSRKLGESIIVPQSQLKITVLGVTGSRVRLGISGPPQVKIHREEIWRRLCRADCRDEAVAAGETG